MRDSLEDFTKHGIAVIGVSFDTPEDNARFARENDFPFPLLSDSDRSLALAVGAADSRDAGYAKRISYLVGTDGRVLAAYTDVDPQTHAAEVVRDLVKLRPDEAGGAEDSTER